MNILMLTYRSNLFLMLINTILSLFFLIIVDAEIFPHIHIYHTCIKFMSLSNKELNLQNLIFSPSLLSRPTHNIFDYR